MKETTSQDATTEKSTAAAPDAPVASNEPTKDAKGRITSTKLTKAQVAKMVKRMVPRLDSKGKPVLDKDKNIITDAQSISESEVMNFAEYADKVVVVTTSGEKLEASK